MMNKSISSITLALIVGFILAACTPKEYTFNVRMDEFKFTPNAFEVSAGSNVTLNLENTGALEHEFVIMVLGKEATLPFDEGDEANIYWEAEVQPGATESVTFVAPTEPGDYQIVCGTAGHLEQGMKATLTVNQ